MYFQPFGDPFEGIMPDGRHVPNEPGESSLPTDHAANDLNRPHAGSNGSFLRQFAAKAKAGEADKLALKPCTLMFGDVPAFAHKLEQYDYPQAPQTQPPEKLDVQSHFLQTHIELKYVSSGSNGSCYLAASKDDVDTAWLSYREHNSQTRLCADLRKAFVVVKFVREKHGCKGAAEDLKKEIETLKFHGLQSTIYIGNLVRFNDNDAARWLTLPYIPGGTLESFVRHCWKDIGIGLQWHLALKLTEALAFIHYGVNNLSFGDKPSNWPLLTFNDLHSGNILLRPYPERGYPSVVIVDFGRAEPLTDGATHSEIRKHFTHLGDDYEFLGRIIYGMLLASKRGRVSDKCKHCKCPRHHRCHCPLVDCTICLKIGKTYSSALLPNLSISEKLLSHYSEKFRDIRTFTTSPHIETVLTSFRAVAREEMRRYPAPLPERVRQRLAQELISDAELIEQMRDLAHQAGYTM